MASEFRELKKQATAIKVDIERLEKELAEKRAQMTAIRLQMDTLTYEGNTDGD